MITKINAKTKERIITNENSIPNELLKQIVALTKGILKEVA